MSQVLALLPCPDPKLTYLEREEWGESTSIGALKRQAP